MGIALGPFIRFNLALFMATGSFFSSYRCLGSGHHDGHDRFLVRSFLGFHLEFYTDFF